MSFRLTKVLNLSLALSLTAYGSAAIAQGLANPPDSVGLLPGIGSSAPVGGVAPGFTIPNMSSYSLPIPAAFRQAPVFAPGMGMKSLLMNRLAPGTVLTGQLEDDISSAKAKIGDIFSIRLEDGFTLDGVEVIPKMSKIVGTVTAVTAARAQHTGQPGQISISLQALVYPDGSSIQFYGFIDHNPAQDQKHSGSASILSGPVNGIRTTLMSVMTGLNSKVGLPLRTPKMSGGLDLKLDKGELLPIKTNRPLDLTQMNAARTPSPSPGVPAQYMAPNAVPGMSNLSPGSFGTGMPLPAQQHATAGLLPGATPPHLSASDLPEPF